MNRIRERRAAAHAMLSATLVALLCLACAGSALGASPRGYARIEPVCPTPGPGEASCFALARVRVPASDAGQPGVQPLAAHPATVKFGEEGGLTPELLESAYGFSGKAGGEGETVAVVDAFDDPAIEEDLEKFSTHYGLDQCTAADGCFKRVNQLGHSAPLPETDKTGWSVETSLDVETVHSACPKCHILLVEATNAKMTNLGTAVRTAVEMGVQVVSNSYGGPEQIAPGGAERALFEHPGTVIAAATGDFGYDWWSGPLPDPESPDAPASYPGVVSVGGTTLTLNGEGKRERETVWNGNGPLNAGEFKGGVTGGGCSLFFEAPFWQRYASGFAATGCGNKRLSADVAAVADPDTGFSIDDTYDCGEACEVFTGGKEWSVIGGTSLATPLISGLYALAGGADGIPYPAMTLYAHLGSASLFDVTQGGNGYCDSEGRACGINAIEGEGLDCEGTTACNATTGYDGPSGVGAPASLEAFKPVPGEEAAARRKAEEAIEAEARRQREEEAARQPKPAPAPSSGQGGTAGFKAEQAAVPAATLSGTRLQAARGGFVTVKVACPAGETFCEGTVSVKTLGAVIAGPGTRASILALAGGRFKVAGGHVVSIRLRLTRRGAALLARKGKLRVRVLIVAHDPAGATHSSHSAVTLYAFKRH
jgi:hypothetical protein